jgi:hypothetical protein
MLLQMPTEDIVRDLLGWRRQRDMKEWENSTAKSTSTDGNEWRRNTKRNLDRGRILICFHISDEKSKAIFLSFWWIRWSKPSLPLNVSQIQRLVRGPEEMGQAFIDWNVNKIWQRLPPATLSSMFTLGGDV